MNQFTQFILLIFSAFSLQLSASELNRTDTIGKFNEVTDIELRIKSLLDTTETSNSHDIAFQDTTRVMEQDSIALFIVQDTIVGSLVQDSILIPITPDSVKLDKTAGLLKKTPVFTPVVITTSLDSLYERKGNGTIQLPDETAIIYGSYISSMNFRDTMLYNPLFLPIVFTGRIENPDSTFLFNETDDRFKGVLISSHKTFSPRIEKQAFADKVRRNYFIENPTKIKLSTSALSGVKQTATDSDVREKFNPFKELLSSQTSFSLEKPDVEGVKIGRVYWIKTAEHSLQFSQNYYSPNWHKGGTSNLNINSNQVFNVNYQKDKVRFNNRLEWRLSVFSTPDDTLRSYRIGDDMIRYYGDFGLDAYKKSWSYSTNLEAKTQLFNNYDPNKPELRSALLSPLYVNAGIGMKYNLDKRSKTVRHRRTRLAISISPLSLNYRYVGNDEVNEKRYGIPEGKSSIFDKGSTVVSNLTYDFSKYISWTSRFKYFTNYSKVEAEFENTLNMSLSQFFSTRIYLHLRYDDSVPSHSDYKYLQINEVVSFGLNYKW